MMFKLKSKKKTDAKAMIDPESMHESSSTAEEFKSSESTCCDAADGTTPETETPCNGVYPQYQDLVGNTPLLDLSHMVKNTHGVEVRLFAKAEFMNPGFSIKDRIVVNILNKAEASGALCPGGMVVAASSGNTGAATAMFCAMRGYGCVITTGAKCSIEKQQAIKVGHSVLNLCGRSAPT
jgi:threonine dehydratase